MINCIQEKPKNYTRNKIIHNAWLNMTCSAPWTVEKFIEELSSYDNEDAEPVNDCKNMSVKYTVKGIDSDQLRVISDHTVTCKEII